MDKQMLVYPYDSIQFSWKEQTAATHSHIDESQNHDTKQKGKTQKTQHLSDFLCMKF